MAVALHGLGGVCRRSAETRRLEAATLRLKPRVCKVSYYNCVILERQAAENVLAILLHTNYNMRYENVIAFCNAWKSLLDSKL